MKFNSQICTSREQSERLLELGLKKDTADVVLLKEMVYDENNHCTRDGDNYLIRPIDYLEGEEHRGHIPAWSLHRLIEMMPTLIGWRDKQYWLDVNNDGVCYSTSMSYALVEFIADNLYDNIIFCIEWLIKEGYFNKEYLAREE